MALILTKKQEDALIVLADREILVGPLQKALKVAEAGWTDVETRFFTERSVEELKLNDALAVVNLKYAAEIDQKRKAVEDAKVALATAESVEKP